MINIKDICADYLLVAKGNITTTTTTFYENLNGKLDFIPDGCIVQAINYASSSGPGSESGNYNVYSSISRQGNEIGTFTLGVQQNSQFPQSHIRLPAGLDNALEFRILPFPSTGNNLNGSVLITMWFYKWKKKE